MWVVLDKKEKAVGILDNELQNGCPILSDTHTAKLENGYTTLSFSVPANHKTATLIEMGGFIVYTNGTDGYELFRVTKTTESHALTLQKDVECETAATQDLLGKIIRPKSFTSTKLSTIVSFLLLNTGWELGTSYYDDLVDIEFDDYPTSLQALRDTIAAFDAEMEFKVEFKGNKVIRKVINLYKERGQKTNATFDYQHNLKDVRRIEDGNKIYTALIGVGNEDSNGKKLSIVDAQVYIPDPFEKVDDYIGDTEALEKYGNNGQHIYGVFSDQNAKNSVEMALNTLAELKKWNKPQVTYETDVIMLEKITGYKHSKVKIGDAILVRDVINGFEEYLNARVLEKTTSITEPDKGTIVLGEYVVLKVNPIISVQQMQKKLKLKEDTWNKAYEKANESLETVNDVKDNIVYKVELASTNGTQFKNGAINTQLYATVFRGKEDISTQLINSQFSWSRLDENGNLDTTWQQAHVNVGRSVTVNGTDVQRRGIFQCNVTIDDKVVGSAQITISDLNDITVSATPPSNPEVGTLWFDKTVEPNVMKVYDGVSYVPQELSVEKLDPSFTEIIVPKDEIITSINQSNEAISINANKLNLNGYVTATGLGTAGQTIINGANITTGSLTADQIKSLNGLNVGNGQFVIDSQGNVKLANGAVLEAVSIKASTLEGITSSRINLGTKGGWIDYTMPPNSTINRTRFGTNGATYLAIDDVPAFFFVLDSSFSCSLTTYDNGYNYGLKLGHGILKGLSTLDAMQIRNANDTDYGDLTAKNLTLTGGLSANANSEVIGSGAVFKVVGSQHGFVEFYPFGKAQGRKGWFGYGTAGDTTFTVKANSALRLESGAARIDLDNASSAIYIKSSSGGDATAYAKTFTPTSRREIKKNIEPFTGVDSPDGITKTALQQINDTPISKYHFNEEFNYERKHVGIIMDQAPCDIVDIRGNGIDLYAMNTYGWAAIQELSRELDKKDSKIQDLEAKNTDLEARLAQLERLIS